MAGFQFARIEVYARKSRSTKRDLRTTQQVFDEAERVPGNAPHVANPKVPSVVDGCSMDELRKLHDAVNEASVVNRVGKSAKIRSTQNTLACAVLSYPKSCQELKEGGKEEQKLYYQWRKDAVDFMKREWGEDFRCAVQHIDEKYPHLHVYAVRDDFDAKQNHPGYAAQEEAKRQGKSVKEAQIAGAMALKDFQNRYASEVAEKYGMGRFGPKRTRDSRKEWTRKQLANDDFARVLRDREAYKKEVMAEVAAEWADTSFLGKMAVSRRSADEHKVKQEVDKQMSKKTSLLLAQVQKADKAAGKIKDKFGKLSEDYNQVLEENREFSSERQSYEIRMAQAELVAQDTIEGLREVAYETSSATAYKHLSAACEKVHETHKADNSVFQSVIKDVRRICGEVKQHVPAVFRKFFGWTPEEQQRQAEKVIKFQPKPEPAPQARSVPRSSPTFGL